MGCALVKRGDIPAESGVRVRIRVVDADGKRIDDPAVRIGSEGGEVKRADVPSWLREPGEEEVLVLILPEGHYVVTVKAEGLAEKRIDVVIGGESPLDILVQLDE